MIKRAFGKKYDHEALPLFEEKERCQYAFSAASAAPQVVLDGRMGMQDVVNDFERATIEISCVCIRDPNAKAIHQ